MSTLVETLRLICSLPHLNGGQNVDNYVQETRTLLAQCSYICRQFAVCVFIVILVASSSTC